MDENDILKPDFVDKGLHIVLTQFICVAIILISVTVVKLFFKDCYDELKAFYTENICVKTEVDEVLADFYEVSDET